MQSLIPLAERPGELLKARGEKIAIAESAAGGLISAELLAVPGASGWCLGGAILYTRQSRLALTIETGSNDRVANMYAFAETGMNVVLDALRQ